MDCFRIQKKRFCTALIPIIILALLFIFSQPLRAQEQELNFINFSIKEGLSASTVNAMTKDRYGYMWFGTDDGLNRFNGSSFTVYTHQAGIAGSIAGNQVLSIYEDTEGNLWVGTNVGLSRYDRKKDCFINYGFTENGAARTICSDRRSSLWIGSYGALYRFEPTSGKVKRYVENRGKPDQLASNTITSIFLDSKHRLWIGSKGGLHLYQEGTDNFRRFSKSLTDTSSISIDNIKSIAEDVNGNIWIGTDGGGLNMLKADGQSFKNYLSNETDPHALTSNRVYCIQPENNGKLWVGTEEGLNIFDLRTETFQRVAVNRKEAYGLKGKSVRSIFIDNDNIYWIGTYHGGINKYDRNLPFFNLVNSNTTEPYGFGSPSVTSFTEAGDGDIYVGTDGGGVNLYHRKTGLSERIDIATGSGQNKRLAILALERVGQELWIGTFQNGVYVFNTVSKAVRHYTAGTKQGELSGNDIFCIKKDSRGNVWVGNNGNGVDIYNPATGLFNRLNEKVRRLDEGSFPFSGFIRAIEEDKDGNIWIASIGAGIAMYSPVTKTFRIFNSGNTGIAIDGIHALLCDRDGIMWAGSPGRGFFKVDYRRNVFVAYAETNGLANGVVYKMLQAADGKIWVSTNKGLSSFDPLQKSFRNYTYHNGLQHNSFNVGAGMVLSSGEMLFGGLEGFNYFLPQALHYNDNVPAIVFSDLKISNKSVIPGEAAAIKEHISIAGEIRLEYKQNFSVDFAVLDYTAPEQARYMYKLEGFDKNWNQTGTFRSAVFANLAPGSYKLQVKATNEDGSWTTAPATIAIYVSPPFWLTTPAFVFYVFAAGLLLFGIRYRGVQKLRAKFALEQERMQVKQMIEQERREAEHQHEFDQARIKFLTNLSHELRTPISLISGPVDQLAVTESNADKLRHISMIKRNAKRLMNLVDQLLDFRKMEEKELKLNPVKGDFVAFVKEVAESFKDISERKQISFNFSHPSGRYMAFFDHEKIERVLFNLLSNALKFTGKGGFILLDLEFTAQGDARMEVSDSGIGITSEVQEKIFERFFRAQVDSSVMNQGSGIGLSITKEFVKLHGGDISVKSVPQQGSVFTVALPLKAELLPEETADASFENPELPSPDTGNNLLPALKDNATDSHGEQHTILVVEDDDDVRSYLTETLKADFKVVEAADGKEGWQKALFSHPHVIISDIGMPGMDGVELCRKLKADKRTSHIPVILLTALTADSDQLKGLQTGANDYLTKPFNFGILNLKIRNLLELNQTFKNTYTRQLKVNSPEIKYESADEKFLLKISAYIEENINSPQLSVEDASRYMGMSRGSLYNKLVEITGETPVEFIRTIRLNKAAAMLESTGMKISDIGSAVGFSSPNYFARSFKIKFNMLPSEYVAMKKLTKSNPA
ncbi:MAG: two-component regulator propeller domain-containing protein [Bacteroidota bacterium]